MQFPTHTLCTLQTSQPTNLFVVELFLHRQHHLVAPHFQNQLIPIHLQLSQQHLRRIQVVHLVRMTNFTINRLWNSN